MRKIFVIIGFCFCFVTQAQIRWNHTYQQYIDQYKDVAIEQMKLHGIPASITLAQGILESAAGRSELAMKGNNHFGIKCNGWTGRTIHHDDDARNECFRAYNTVYESYEDHSNFLTNNTRYRSLFNLKITDYKGWAKGLKAAGYATNPQYAYKLIELIQLYKLYQYDKAKDYDEFMSDHVKHQVNSAIHVVKHFNNNYYIYVRKGDTFRSIAEEMGINYRKLAKYNERGKDDELIVGEVIWLQKKQKKAPKEYKDRLHYIRNGESMYSIAQQYGIRLKNLYKMNHLSPNYQICVGDALRLR